MKTCSCCGIEKPLNEFRSDFNKKNGLTYYSKVCKLCKAPKKLQWAQERVSSGRKKRDSKKHYENNKEAHNLRGKNWRKKNLEKDRNWRRGYNKNYYQENKEKMQIKGIADSEKRRAIKLNATLGLKFNKEFKELVKLCKELEKSTGIKHHIDHIIPLKNDKVCGLHVPANLQILTETENCSKLNSFDGTYENLGWKERL